MQRTMFKSTILRATITSTNSKGMESVMIDEDLLALADILPGELVLVVNTATGARARSHAMAAKAGSGTFKVNGSATSVLSVGDIISVFTHAIMDDTEAKSFEPAMVHVNNKNKAVRPGVEPVDDTTDGLYTPPFAIFTE